jgi:hypothetical protein
LKNISQKFLWLEGWKKKYRSGKRNCPHTHYWVVKWAMEHKIWNMIYYWKNWNISSKYYQINNFCSFKFIILFVQKKFIILWNASLISCIHRSMSLAQLVGHCIIYAGVGVRTPVIPLIHLMGGISCHWATWQKKKLYSSLSILWKILIFTTF